jgi:fatty-acyl-CoA synthase
LPPARTVSVRSAPVPDDQHPRRLTTSEWLPDTSSALLEATVGDLLRAAAAELPDAVALTEGNGRPDARRWTFAGLLQDAESVARWLLTRFRPGERVAVWAPNAPEWILAEFGCALAGLTLVTVNPAFGAAELRHVLESSSAAGVLVAREFRGVPIGTVAREVAAGLPGVRVVIDLDELGHVPHVDGTLPVVTPDAIAQIQFTSGTTGRPKGALLHHRGLVNNARFFADRAGLQPRTSFLNPMPLFHTAGCVSCTLGPVAKRMELVLMPAFEPGLALGLIESSRVTGMGTVPTMALAMMEHPDFTTRDLAALDVLISGGTTVPADLVRRIEATLGARMIIVYGQTEASPLITATRPDDSPDDKALTIGRPLPHAHCRIVDEHGAVRPVGTAGEICVRGYQVMAGYEGLPDATAAAVDAEGFLHTGDLGTMDERGYVTITGRLKDLIIRGGENIYPREIEERLFEHPDVSEVAVVGVPDDRWGEVVAAVVRPVEGATPTAAALHDWCRATLAPFKTPARWFVVEQFPMTASGKVQKYVLTASAAAGELTPLP